MTTVGVSEVEEKIADSEPVKSNTRLSADDYVNSKMMQAVLQVSEMKELKTMRERWNKFRKEEVSLMSAAYRVPKDIAKKLHTMTLKEFTRFYTDTLILVRNIKEEYSKAYAESYDKGSEVVSNEDTD